MTNPSVPTPKPYILDIAPYVPGVAKAADGRALTKLSANENPLGCSEAALTAMMQSQEAARYPDPDSIALRTALGELHGIERGSYAAPARTSCSTSLRRHLRVWATRC